MLGHGRGANMKPMQINRRTKFASPLTFALVCSGLKALAIFMALLASSEIAFAQAQTQITRDTIVESTRNGAATKFVSRNIYSAGANVRPSAAVEGDFVAVGGRVIIDQPVKGDVMLAGGSVDVRAPVGDDVRAAGGDINVEGTIGGELFATGGNITLTKAARVASTASLFGGTVSIDGRIDGPLSVSAQKVVLNGEVNNDARFRAEQIELGPFAKITGTLDYASPNEIKRADGATIGGAISRMADDSAMHGHNMHETNQDWHMRMGRGGSTWVGSIFTFLAFLACAAVFLLIFPTFSVKASDAVRTSPWAAMTVGFGAVVCVPVLAILLFITILGIPLGIITVALYPLLLLLGYVVGVLFVARRAQNAMSKDESGSFVKTIGFFALALLLVMLLGRLPFVGGLVIFVITIIGIGASLIEMYSWRQVKPPSPPNESSGLQMVSVGT
jgi:cytoskeletal protein CcmA (bactofilin family)